MESKKIPRRTDSPESRAFWQGVEKSAALVQDWPDWRQAGITIDRVPENPDSEPIPTASNTPSED